MSLLSSPSDIAGPEGLRADIDRLHQALAILSAKDAPHPQEPGDFEDGKRVKFIQQGSPSDKSLPSTSSFLQEEDDPNHQNVSKAGKYTEGRVISPYLSSNNSRSSSTTGSESIDSVSSIDTTAPQTPSTDLQSRRSSAKDVEDEIEVEESASRKVWSVSNLRRRSSEIKTASISDYQLVFSRTDVPAHATHEKQIIDKIVERYPELCERPPRMFTDDGIPLPPTAQQEAGKEEKQARKLSIGVVEHGSLANLFLKTSVLLESRSAVWKRVGEVESEESNIEPSSTHPSTIDPWKIELNHSNLDLSRIKSGKPAKKNLEVYKSRRVGVCQSCQGSKKGVCRTCRGSEPDECWWCKGSKKSSSTNCHHCLGSGVLACQGCKGTKIEPCTPCHAKGTGVFVVHLQVRLSRVDLDPVSLATIDEVKQGEGGGASKLEKACMNQSRRSVADFVASLHTLTTRRGSQESSTLSESGRAPAPVQHRPRQVHCQLTTSATQLIELKVPQAARVVKKAKSNPSLCAANPFSRKIPLSSSYFLLPSDDEFGPIQVSLAEFERAMEHQQQRR